MIIGRFHAARIESEQALRFKPCSAESACDIGKLFSLKDMWEPARRQFEAALRLEPGDLEAIDGLGFALDPLADHAWFQMGRALEGEGHR